MTEFNDKIDIIAGPVIKELNKKLTDQATIVIAASHLDINMLPEIYNHLNYIGFNKTLNVVLYTKGGDVNATRRIALLLKNYCETLNIIAPYYCQSSGTLLALSANTLYYSQLSIFSAIDPHLHGGKEEQDTALSSADIKLFSSMSKDWFNTEITDESNMLGMLCEHIFPPTLTAFYRTVLEVKEIAEELLRSAGQYSETTQQHIIETLMFSFHSHDYAVTGLQLAELDLPCQNDEALNQIVWPLVEYFSQYLGGGNRRELSEPWCDSIIISSGRLSTRWKDMSGLNPQWTISK